MSIGNHFGIVKTETKSMSTLKIIYYGGEEKVTMIFLRGIYEYSESESECFHLGQLQILMRMMLR